MDSLLSVLGRSGYLPHGYCISWSPGLLWSMVTADLLIALAYFSIPLAIVSLARRRPETKLGWLPWLFSAFIFACGTTHVMDVWTLWQPDYALQALSKLVTAAVSVVTAIALWPLIPRALKIPSVSALKESVRLLEAEVAKRRSAEEMLIDAELNLAATLTTIGAGFIATDRAGLVTHMNSVAERLTGWAQAEAQGRVLWEVLVREGRPAALEDMNPVDVLQTRGTTADTSHEFTVVSRNGRQVAVDVKAALTRTGEGTVRGMALVIRDMTQLQAAEADASRLAALVESSFDAIIGKTVAGTITSWNAAAEQLFGWRADEAIGRSVEMLIPPDRLAEEMRIVTELSRGVTVPPFDTVRQRKDGRLIELSVTISPIRDAHGRIVGASKIARDVSAQRLAESARRESEARLRFALEAGRIGDWELDLTTGRVLRSLRYDRCFGYTSPEPEWTIDTFMQHVHPLDRPEVGAGFGEAVARHTAWHTQCRVTWPDASVHWISVHGQVMLEEGAARRMIGIVTDVTRQREVEAARLRAQQLEAEKQQMVEASQLKSQFLANMSHELRTPLNAIIGFADLLSSGAVPHASPKHAQFLGLIGSSGRHLLQLINDVLDLAKVESGKFEFFAEPVDLAALVDEIKQVMQQGLSRKRLRLSIEIDAGLTDLLLDPSRLKQVLFNYLSNAIKFTPEGGHIAVRARAEGALQFRLEVEDSGMGIAESDLPRLFGEFQQLDAGYSKHYQGTGLGLALTRRLAEAQGGSAGVRSTLGVGSTFHVVLPRWPGAVVIDAERTAPRALDAARLLVIERDPVLSARLTRLLGDAGFEVDATDSGSDARRRATQRSYHGISLQLMLEGEHGLGVLADIRRHTRGHEAPVLGVTMGIEAGVCASFAVADVLSKPIRSSEITAAITRLRSERPGPLKVLVVDDDAAALTLMEHALTALGIEAVCRQDARGALAEMGALRPDAIVLDLMMPGFDGFAMLDALNRLEGVWRAPVFIWTSMILTDDEYATLARSARAIVGKGGGDVQSMLEALRRPTRVAEMTIE